MIRFFKQIVLFFALFGGVFLIGIFLPITPMNKNNMLSYKVKKDSLLQFVESPRIIFIGGSNLVFGLNSQMIKDSLKVNPINNGLAASIGLIYMMDDTFPFVRKGDYVVLAMEYDNYYGNNAYGGHTLFRLLMDVERSGFKKLRVRHLPNLVKSLPTYFMSKFTLKSYDYDGKNDIYGKHIFNEYGDSEFHWGLKKRDFPQMDPIKGDFNFSIIAEIIYFNNKLNEIGATLLVTYPACLDTSLEINKVQIDRIQQELERTNLTSIGTPQRYSFPDSLMFEQVYHLGKAGVDRRTKLLIEDIKATDLLN